MRVPTSTGIASSPTGAVATSQSTQQWLLALFLWSGMAALTYQVCWQRVLFFSFGTDIESVTIVVSTFMLGLGLGALLGGALADRYPRRIILLFVLAELGIGAFGIASPQLITRGADLFIQSGRAVTAAVTFVLLLLPTCLMGMTLPMLIAHFARNWSSVGVSTGQLYFANTLGAAVGCLAVGFVGFRFLPLDQVIYLAAAINLTVAASGFLRLRMQP